MPWIAFGLQSTGNPGVCGVFGSPFLPLLPAAVIQAVGIAAFQLYANVKISSYAPCRVLSGLEGLHSCVIWSHPGPPRVTRSCWKVWWIVTPHMERFPAAPKGFYFPCVNLDIAGIWICKKSLKFVLGPSLAIPLVHVVDADEILITLLCRFFLHEKRN